MRRAMCIILLTLFAVQTAQAASKPNVVLILADDMGMGDVSALNPNSKIQTPAIDRLVQEGVRFVDAHSASSVCTPTRYGLLTGRYCWRTRLKSRVLNGYSPCLIEKDRSTLATIFQSNGYTTAMFGKWHLGLGWTTKTGETITYEGDVSPIDEAQVDFTKPIQHGPVDLGFDCFYGVSASWDFPPYVFIQNRQVTVFPTQKVGGRLRPSTQEELSLVAAAKDEKERKRARDAFPKTSWRSGLADPNMKVDHALRIITEKTVAYIQTQSAELPFFLYMSLTAPLTFLKAPNYRTQKSRMS
ncbi:sulfatase-like hydrolase/transferase [Planctomycetota bacterium]